MFTGKLSRSLNVVVQCREYGVGLWSCPQFLFLVMGLVIVGSILSTYTIAQRYVTPELVLMIVLSLSSFLFIITYIIVRSFEKLVEAKKEEALQAQELLRLKDQFVFIAAHELRTPSTIIKWNLELLEAGENYKNVTEQEKKIFGHLHQSNERLLALVEDILGVARIEGGTIKISSQKIVLSGIVKASLEELELEAQKARVKLVASSFQNIPAVYADPMRLREALINLVSNGIKFNKKGGKVTVSAEVKDDQVIVHVSDTGIGIRTKDQGHVFEKFWRAGEAEGVEGTGLGLFIVKNLIDLMSGKIWFKSELGKGTKFSFSLPVYKEV